MILRELLTLYVESHIMVRWFVHAWCS